MLSIFPKKKLPDKPAEATDAFAVWLNKSRETEGHLAVDVYQTEDKIIVKATIAGAKSENISIAVNGDMLTIRGERHLTEVVAHQDYLYRECYWGRFSRTIVLPVQVDEDKVEAGLEDGVLTVVLPKAQRTKEFKVKVNNNYEI